jgi:hypothetical protein
MRSKRADVPGERMAEQGRTIGGKKPWAVIRIALGLAQVMAATGSLVFLLQTGMSALAVTATFATVLFVVASKLLFREG